MRNLHRGVGLVGIIAASALALSACGGGTKSETTGTEGAGGASTGVVTANGTEPQNPLLPSATNEVGGGRIIDLVYGKLVYYDAKGEVHNEQATDISSTDGQNWTIKIQDGLKFTDGSPVDAQAFVDSWNYGANSKNGQLASNFYAPIEGYDAVSATKDTGKKDEEGEAILEPAPTAETMSGLKVVSPTEFTVKLISPEADFKLRLGYSAYSAIPSKVIADGADAVKAFGENPASSGPYKLAKEGAWVHNQGIDLVPNPDFKGDRTAKNGGVSFKFYADNNSAYQDLLSNNLDVLDQFPDEALGTWENDLGDRGVNQPAAVFQSFTIPERLKHFGNDEEGKLRRQALSYSIDRKTITEKIFSNTRTPAKDFTSPVIAGYNETVAGNEVLNYDPEKAKALWAQADAISKWDGSFQIAYNSDGPHKGWVDATANSIKNTLGIDASGKPYPSFGEFRAQVTERKIETAFRTGWQADYPSLYNFLFPLYASASADGNGSNDGDYKSPEFDKLMEEGAASATVEEANAKFEQAQTVLFKDLPAIPLWYQNVSGGWSEKVKGVVFDWKSVPIYNDITKE